MHYSRGSKCAATLPLSQAPAQPAILAGRRRLVGQQGGAEILVRATRPDFPQRLLRRISKRVVLISPLRERCDAAGERATVGGEIHHRPRPATQRPRRAALAALETHARFGCRARGAECHPERSCERGGTLEM